MAGDGEQVAYADMFSAVVGPSTSVDQELTDGIQQLSVLGCCSPLFVISDWYVVGLLTQL